MDENPVMTIDADRRLNFQKQFTADEETSNPSSAGVGCHSVKYACLRHKLAEINVLGANSARAAGNRAICGAANK